MVQVRAAGSLQAAVGSVAPYARLAFGPLANLLCQLFNILRAFED
jgi:hypothetical protein